MMKNACDVEVGDCIWHPRFGEPVEVVYRAVQKNSSKNWGEYSTVLLGFENDWQSYGMDEQVKVAPFD
jgi:hypothetical protein